MQSETGEPRILTSEEAKALTLQRGRDIKAGRAKLIAHETVMQKMEQMLAVITRNRQKRLWQQKVE